MTPETLRICSRCGFPKPLTLFVKDRRTPSGHTNRCLECERKRVKAWSATEQGRSYNKAYRAAYVDATKPQKKAYDATRYPSIKERVKARVAAKTLENAALIDSIKSGPCQDCGRVLPPLCMDLDHVRGEKVAKLSLMKCRKTHVILTEAAKCDLVCANCHRVRTEQRRTRSQNPTRLAFREKIDSLKANPCGDCLGVFSTAAMDFDHVRGDKVESISNMYWWPWDDVLLELAKCDVVCAACHRLRTEFRRKQGSR